MSLLISFISLFLLFHACYLEIEIIVLVTPIIDKVVRWLLCCCCCYSCICTSTNHRTFLNNVRRHTWEGSSPHPSSHFHEWLPGITGAAGSPCNEGVNSSGLPKRAKTSAAGVPGSPNWSLKLLKECTSVKHIADNTDAYRRGSLLS